MTTPMDQDDSRYNRFIRRDRRYITYFNTIYKSSYTLRYIGEWHTHPEAVPIYSSIDLKNWEKIYRGADYKNSYHIIVGYEIVMNLKFEHARQSPQLVGSWGRYKSENRNHVLGLSYNFVKDSIREIFPDIIIDFFR